MSVFDSPEAIIDYLRETLAGEHWTYRELCEVAEDIAELGLERGLALHNL